MSSSRTRPTRTETRSRLIEAGARVFADKGIAATTVGDVVDEAGYTRGAFYSSFADKHALVDAIYSDHIDRTVAVLDRLLGEATDSDSLRLRATDLGPDRAAPLDANPGLFAELLLYAMRDPSRRDTLVANAERTREATTRVVREIELRSGEALPAPADQIADLLIALDTGVAVMGLLDPARYPSTRFPEFVQLLTTATRRATE